MSLTDSQVIICFETGSGDELIRKNAKAINDLAAEKNTPSEIIRMRGSGAFWRTFNRDDTKELAKALKKLTVSSRVYLQAHGDWQSQKLGDWDADAIASLLGKAGMPSVRRLSVLGCELGRDLGTANDQRVGSSVNNFGAKLQKALKDDWKIWTVVMVRVFCLGVGRIDSPNSKAHGNKYTFDKDDKFDAELSARHRVHSKRRFYWGMDGSQQWEWG